MKNCFNLFLFLFLALASKAQDESIPSQLSFAYYGNVVNEQGIRVSGQFYLKNWFVDKDENKVRNYSLYIQPNAGFISRPLFYSNLQLAADIGVQRKGKNSKFYHSVNIGLGYVARMEIVSFTTDFKGEIISRERESWDYIMPTFSYEVGKEIVSSIGWFVKLNYGLQLPIQESQEERGMPLFELGMKLPLTDKN